MKDQSEVTRVESEVEVPAESRRVTEKKEKVYLLVSQSKKLSADLCKSKTPTTTTQASGSRCFKIV